MFEPQDFSQVTSLSRDTIARAALQYVELNDLDKLTMRALASSLGCGTMSLYSYVANRDDLLVAISELLTRPVQEKMRALDRGEGWFENAHTVVRVYRDLAVDYPRSFELLALSPYEDGQIADHLQQLVTGLVERGLDEDIAYDLIGTLDAFMSGFLVVWARGRRLRDEAVAAGTPLELSGTRARVAEMRALDAFDRGVASIFAGFKQRIDEAGTA